MAMGVRTAHPSHGRPVGRRREEDHFAAIPSIEDCGGIDSVDRAREPDVNDGDFGVAARRHGDRRLRRSRPAYDFMTAQPQQCRQIFRL